MNSKPRNKPLHIQMIFNKGAKTIQYRKHSLFQQMVLGEKYKKWEGREHHWWECKMVWLLQKNSTSASQKVNNR